MKLIDAYATLHHLKLSVLQTQDVAAILDVNIAHASKILTRLSDAKQMIHLTRGIWAFPDIDPLTLPSFLTLPFPAYVSLQTALYYHGMISQIPSIIYAVSLARTRRYQTPLANVSIHHIQPSLFFGYDEKNNGSIKMATPEKALLDLLYLSPTKSQLFHTLPEIELPRTFKYAIIKKMIDQITSIRRKTLVERRLKHLFTN